MRILDMKELSGDEEIFILSVNFLFNIPRDVSLNTVLSIVTREKTSFLDFVRRHLDDNFSEV